jgi:hypothetical protein
MPLTNDLGREVIDHADETIIGASFESSATGVSPRWIAF